MDERNRANRQKYRMVALDLDGTLLNSNHDISDATIEYLRRLHEKGFIVCIATGRSVSFLFQPLPCLIYSVCHIDIIFLFPLHSYTKIFVCDNNNVFIFWMDILTTNTFDQNKMHQISRQQINGRLHAPLTLYTSSIYHPFYMHCQMAKIKVLGDFLLCVQTEHAD